MLAAYKLRAVPINVNYRYVEDELRYLFDNADLVALVHQAQFAPRDRRGARAAAAAAPPRSDRRRQRRRPLDDRVGPLRGRARRASRPSATSGPRSDDDLYILYTGGTTGHAQGRGVAPGGRLARARRRHRLRHRRAHRGRVPAVARRGRDATKADGHRARAADARRRAVGHARRPVQGHHASCSAEVRRRTRCGRPSSSTASPSSPSPATPWPGRSSRRSTSRRLRHVVARRDQRAPRRCSRRR